MSIKKLALFSALIPGLAASAAQIGSVAPDFTIKDQYDHDVQLSAQRGKPVLLVYGDRLGREYMSEWADAVRRSAETSSVNLIHLANLHAVPSLLRGYVKRMFQKPSDDGKPGRPVLLDWDAAVAKMYGFTDDVTNVYLIDEKGILRYVASGKGTPEETGRLVEMIANLGRTD